MQRIKVMSETLANQIAAGEVVERPSSVVKELVENAIDAGSENILIEIVEAGIQSIRVTDDGHGIYPDDLVLAFAPHATSKIIKPEDIFNIASLGFRGEALASIASVAKVIVASKTSEDHSGHFIKIEGSQIIEQGQSKAKDGTSILVESLFYNTPARLKHLKSLNTEIKHILNFIQNLALSYPDIRFILKSDGKEVFKSFGNGASQQAIASVYQPKIARQLVELQAEDVDFRIAGFISLPNLTRTSMNYIHWFINHRPVKSRMLTEVLVKAYGKQIMVGRYPIAIINVQLDPRLVDVNVHPTKQIVRLSKEDELSELLRQTVRDTLNKHGKIPLIDLETDSKTISEKNLQSRSPVWTPYQETSIPYKDHHQKQSCDHLDSGIYTSNSINEQTVDVPRSNLPKIHSKDTQQLTFSTDNKHIDKDANSHLDPFQSNKNIASPVTFSNLRYIGQFHGTYLLAEDDTGLYFIDQHAAQEVIRYEYFMSEDYNVDQQQQLLFPEIIECSISQVQDILENDQAFKRLGIELNQFSPTSFQLESYPSWVDDERLQEQINDVIDKVCQNPQISIHELISASLIMRSCRGAIKANHHLDPSQAKYLIESLDQLDDPYHCPHGRPVIIKLTPKSLEKLFKRIQDSHTSQFDAQF